jgi:hypothetical protein
MRKILLALLFPLVASASSIQTKPYDDLKKGDIVVTNVLFSGGDGGGSGLSNVVIAGMNASRTGLVVNYTSTVTLTAWDIGAVSNTPAGIAAAGGVTTNMTSVTFANWRFNTLYGGAINGLWPLSGVGTIYDRSTKSVLSFSTDNRYLFGIDGESVASFGGEFSVGTFGNEIPVYSTLALHTAQLSTAVTNGVFSVGTIVSNVAGVLYIPTNGFGGGSGSGYSSVSAFATNAYFTTNAGVVVGIQSNSIVTLTSHAVTQTNINNAVASSLSTLTNRPYVATVNGQTGNVTIAASLPAGAIVATNTPVAGQSFFGSSGTKDGVITGYFATASGSGDMLKSEYDAGGVKQVAFTNDPRIVLALTNAAVFATAAQGAKADTALQPANTSGWVVASHDSLYPRSNPSNWITLAQVPAQTNMDLSAYYPRSNPSNWITLAQVPAQTTQLYIAEAGNAYTVNGLTSTQILATATNSFALRSWVTGFSNAPATWNADFRTIDITNPDGTVLQVGQEQVVVVRNDNSYTITNGKACSAYSANGFYSSARLASATDTLDQVMSIIGLATMDIAPGAIGKITTIGNVNDLNTTAFNEGSNLWLSATPGELTMVMPACSSASRIIRMGQCLRSHANVGRIGVSVSHVPRATDLCAETNGTAAAAAAVVSNALAPRIVALEDRTNAWNAAAAHTNRTDNPHDTSAAQVGAVPTNRTLTLNGQTWTMDSNGVFTVTGGSANAVTNNGATILGYTLTNGTDIDFPVTVWSNTPTSATIPTYGDVTNVVREALGRFVVTNTVAVTNYTTFSIPLPYSSVCLDDVRVFATTSGSYSKRYALRFFRRPGPAFRRTDLAYMATNCLLYATTSTVAQAVGSLTNIVPDASGIVWPIDAYYQTYGAGTNDYVSYTNATATVLWQCCTNNYAQPAGALISRVEQLGSFNYWNASGASSLEGDITPTTGHTGDVTFVIDGALK